MSGPMPRFTARQHAVPFLLLLVLCSLLSLAPGTEALSLAEQTSHAVNRATATLQAAVAAREGVVHASGVIQGRRVPLIELRKRQHNGTEDTLRPVADDTSSSIKAEVRPRRAAETTGEERRTLHPVDELPLIYRTDRTTVTQTGPTERVIDVQEQNTHMSVTLVGDGKTILRFKGVGGNVINAVVQLKNKRYDSSVSRYNCEGMYVGASLRTGWQSQDSSGGKNDWGSILTKAELVQLLFQDNKPNTEEAGQEEDGSEGGEGEAVEPREAQVSFWDIFSSLLDTSPLCKMYQTVSMRLSKAPRTEDYYVVLSSSIMREYRYDVSNPVLESNFQCALEVYLSQDPAKRLFTLQIIFSVVLPLLIVLVPLPFFLRHVDVIQDAILDVDIGDWFWLPPYLLRKLIVELTVGTYTRITTYRLERRERARQRLLAERQQQLSREMNQEREAAASPMGAASAETHWEGDSANPTAVVTVTIPRGGNIAGVEATTRWSEGNPVTTVVTIPREEREGMMQSQSDSSAPRVPAGEEEAPVVSPTLQCTPAKTATVGAASVGATGSKKAHDVLFTAASKEEEEEEEKSCRICRDGDELEPLVAPCACIGSVRWIHRSCLDHWRMESAKRNLSNVNNCEICKQPFNLSISRRTLVCESSKRIVWNLLLFFTSLLCLFLILAGAYGGVGELSCLGMQHEVAYSSVYTLEGIIMALLVYSIVVLLAMMAHMIVYSWFLRRSDVEEYIRETRMEPPFWGYRNVLAFVCVLLVLAAQVTSMGYLIKMLIYSTSNIVWNWEVSPILGCVCAGVLLPAFLHIAQGVHALLRRWRGANGPAEDVVIENPTDIRGGSGIASHPRGAPLEEAPQGEGEAAAAEVPPEMRVIRAMEYCPPRRPPLRA